MSYSTWKVIILPKAEEEEEEEEEGFHQWKQSSERGDHLNWSEVDQPRYIRVPIGGELIISRQPRKTPQEFKTSNFFNQPKITKTAIMFGSSKGNNGDDGK